MMNKQDQIPYEFSVAGADDNADILQLLRRSPIRMEMDYIMDRHSDFFRLHRLLPGSKVLLARDRETGVLQGFLSLLQLEGQIGGAPIRYLYVTDLIKAPENRHPLMMKKLLNYGFQHFFDTAVIFGLINARNSTARLFSTSSQLQYPGQMVHKFHYLEMAPLWRQRIPSRYSVRPVRDEADLALAIQLINEHYRNHELYLPLNAERMAQQFAELPGFGLADVWLASEEGKGMGAMITYRPEKLSSLILARLDCSSKLLFPIIRFLNQTTGLLFNPPRDGEYINTLQVRYLAGSEPVRSALLKAANNLAYAEKRHSVSMLLDVDDPLKPANWVTYRYQSLMYANCQKSHEELLSRLDGGLVFFDIVWG